MMDDKVARAFGTGDEEPPGYIEYWYHVTMGNPHLVGEPYFVRHIEYPGTVLDFQAVLNHLARKYQWGWLATNGERLYIDSQSAPVKGSARWEVHSDRIERYDDGSADIRIGTIEAHEEPNQHTWVYFLDGGPIDDKGQREPDPPIGEAFTEFVDAIIDEIVTEIPAAVVLPQFSHRDMSTPAPEALQEPQVDSLGAKLGDSAPSGAQPNVPTTETTESSKEKVPDSEQRETHHPDLQRSHREESPVRATSENESSEPYTFRKEGDYWRIVFAGRMCTLKSVIGLSYIAHLLSQPGKHIHVSELEAALHPRTTDPAAEQVAHMSKQQLAQEGLRRSDGGNSDAILDRSARDDYKKTLEENIEKRKNALARGDEEEIERLDKECEWIKTQLTQGTGLGSRDRRFPTEVERARIRVKGAIDRARSNIKEHDPVLYEHLRTSVRTGRSCIYLPPETIDWAL